MSHSVRQYRPTRQAPARSERPLWLFLTEPGLGPLLLRELKFRDAVGQKAQAAKLHLRNYDVLVLPDAAMRDRKPSPRLASHVLVCPVFGRTQIGARQLELLARSCAHEKSDGLIASVAGETFSGPDFESWIRRGLAERQVRLDARAPQRPVRLIAVDEKFYLGFERYNHHSAIGRVRTAEREGSLPPIVAAAMAFAAKLEPGEVVWDPVVGTGTILAEIAQLAPDATMIGTDIDAPALAVARRNLTRARATLMRADATAIELGRSDLTLTIANLPFGKQFKAAIGNRELYTGILRRALAQAAPKWRAVLLTSDGDALDEAVSSVGGLTLGEIASVQVRGVKAGIWLVARG